MFVSLAVCAFFLSFTLTIALREYAMANYVLDIPNHRSSHSKPTPRGGGAAIVISFVAALLIFGQVVEVSNGIYYGLTCTGVAIALIGFWDDRSHLDARWRLLAHFLFAGLLSYWLGGLPSLSIIGFVLDLSWFYYVLATIYMVWLLNLYNFMDGIDGIASVEAVTVCIGGALVLMVVGVGVEFWMLPLLLAMAVLGFSLWNLPPAKIFMGDVGSGFLGLILGGLSIHAAWVAPQLFWSWLILLGVFIVDATLTLIRRVLRGEKFYLAHCSHAYQHAARKLGAHLPVSAGVGVINLCWLLPWALLVAAESLDGFWGLMVAYIPLILLATYYKAGGNYSIERSH